MQWFQRLTTSSSSLPSSALQEKQQKHDAAYQCIHTAIDLETKLQGKAPTLADVQSIIDGYTKGLALLKQAMEMNVAEVDREQAFLLNRKMQPNVSLVEERLAYWMPKLQPVPIPASVRASQKRMGSPSIVSNANTGNKRTGATEDAANVNAAKLNVDPKMAHAILNDLIDYDTSVTLDDVVGLEAAKQAIRETVILPALRPDLFTGLRAPVRGLLLFGPPGTGKTLLAKATAHASKAKFFSISAASLTSKYLGESEKMVRTLFTLARHLQPSIIFIDEIDSLLSARNSQSEHEASRRLKTEFLVQFDGLASDANASTNRLLVMAATNRPQELDEAARRRFVKRIYIPLPEPCARMDLLKRLMKNQKNDLTQRQLDRLVTLTEGKMSYSASDLTALAKDAALQPLREYGNAITTIAVDQIRPVQMKDFESSLKQIRASVSRASLQDYETFDKTFGSGVNI